MYEINLTADELIRALPEISGREIVCILDSCGISNLGSHLLIAGIRPVEIYEIKNKNAAETLEVFKQKTSNPDLAYIFTISYDFGLKLENLTPRDKEFPLVSEPDIFLAAFDCLIVHDYDTQRTFLTGEEKRFVEIEKILLSAKSKCPDDEVRGKSIISANFTRDGYIKTVEKVQEYIRRGDTYQTNLTQQIRAVLPENLNAQKIFRRLRENHPAPFAAFIKRINDTVVSISPERFFKVESRDSQGARIISTSPIKGTKPRGKNEREDELLKNELLASEKNRAENVMIVDLLRNDIGRICRFGTVKVEKLCELEAHPTLFHLVSTINGELRENVNFTDIIKAVFPCGSITGAPKIRTMRIIDELETANRGLSMGAIGYLIENPKFQIPNSIDLSVAIRTMVIKDGEAVFNVGGGIVIDSDPEDEYRETLVKAKALLNAVGGHLGE